MNQQHAKGDDFPFIKDQGHIYNLLDSEGFHKLDFGWIAMEFELHANLKHDGTPVDGVTIFSEKVIKLDMGLPDSEARETVMHEIMHVLLEGIGMDERLFDGDFIKTTNEYLANTLPKQLNMLNRLNPGILALLYSNDIQTTFN